MGYKNGHPSEPTGDQCSAHERLPDFNGQAAYACWYPQMGGYVGKCVVVLTTGGPTHDDCFEAFVWHDGDFPFESVSEYGDERAPAQIHHCMPSQFIDFGRFVLDKQKELNP